MRYLPSLGVGNTQLIKGKKRRGFLNHSQKKKKITKHRLFTIAAKDKTITKKYYKISIVC